MFLSGSPVRALDNNTNDKNYIIPMEKKMYNQPLTITTEVETMSVIMSVSEKEDLLSGGNGEAEAPPRYPKY